jgi:hypothetical protein
MWLAAKGNLQHGLPLNRAALREAFRRFVKAGMNRMADGTLMSTRALARELGMGSHQSMMNWMKQDFPKIAAEMRGRDPEEIDDEPIGNHGESDQLIANVHWAEQEYLRAISKALRGADRDALISALGDITKKIEKTLALPAGGLGEKLRDIEERELTGEF